MDVNNEVIKSLSTELRLPASVENDFMNHLVQAINNLIQNDFPLLVQILYRMDISEQKLKEMLVKYPNDEAGLIIGQLLVERESQKIRRRGQFKSNDTIPEDEKW